MKKETAFMTAAIAFGIALGLGIIFIIIRILGL